MVAGRPTERRRAEGRAGVDGLYIVSVISFAPGLVMMDKAG